MKNNFWPNGLRVLILVGALATGACTKSDWSVLPQTVTLGGQTYADADAGLAAANAACSFILGSVEPLETPVIPRLRVVRPINPIIATNGLASRGIPRDWMVSYMLRASIIEIDCIRAAIGKRNIAETMTGGLSSDGLHEDPQDGVPVIYLYLPNHRSALWIFASDTVGPIGLAWDPSIKDTVLRYMDFLGIIERLATL